MVIARFTVILGDVGEPCAAEPGISFAAGSWITCPSSVLAPNRLQHKFEVATPNGAWVTDITHIGNHQGWWYLAVVIDLYSRQRVGWSMQSLNQTKELALDALLMAEWRRKPRSRMRVHSEKGGQYTSHDWHSFLQANNLQASVSCRGGLSR